MSLFFTRFQLIEESFQSQPRQGTIGARLGSRSRRMRSRTLAKDFVGPWRRIGVDSLWDEDLARARYNNDHNAVIPSGSDVLAGCLGEPSGMES